ncbi:MAG: FtsW/RodA/SpoVE family cell cycle protein, partial [Bacteroidota bacterium]
MIKWLLHRIKGDKIIWLLIFSLAVVGLLAIYSASSALSFRQAGEDTEYYMLTHIIQLIMGFGVMYVVHLLNYRVFARITQILLVVTIPLLLYTILKGSEIN